MGTLTLLIFILLITVIGSFGFLFGFLERIEKLLKQINEWLEAIAEN